MTMTSFSASLLSLCLLGNLSIVSAWFGNNLSKTSPVRKEVRVAVTGASGLVGKRYAPLTGALLSC